MSPNYAKNEVLFLRLPEKFQERMQDLLKEEWPQLLSSWKKPEQQGLRVNTLKISSQEFVDRAPFEVEPVPWEEAGFYLLSADKPAKHPYFQAGLYYLQEPSAMAPVPCLGVQPGDKVLDLCAAPGGKSTQIAARLQGSGLLVCNDNNRERVKALVWNLERCGVSNAVVTWEEPARLAGVFPSFFDKILIDAPCSGEGMFRRDERAVKSWEEYNSTVCASIQKEILTYAAQMLKPGGKMLYSTCTFAPEENEAVLAAFLKKHPGFSLEELPLGHGWDTGRIDWLPGKNDKREDIKKARRLWPHKTRGEGHFLALLKKQDASADNAAALTPKYLAANDREADNEFRPLLDFVSENLRFSLKGPFIKQGQYVYKCPAGLPALGSLQVPRPGWFLGTLAHNRFEPSQALAMALRIDDVKNCISFPSGDSDVSRYLRGETLMHEGEKGWTLIALEGFPLGWGKQSGQFIKNHYPPKWRVAG